MIELTNPIAAFIICSIRLFQRVKENTVSLWSYIITERRRFLNPFYNQYPRFVDILRPNARLMCIKVWKDYYFRYNPAIVAQDHMVAHLFRFISNSV